MFARSFSTIVTLLLLVSGAAVNVAAAPIEARKIASLSCNVARAKLIANLLKATLTVQGMKAKTTDADATEQITSAADGLAQIRSAIEDVAINVAPFVIGLGAPPEDRDKVTAGLNQTNIALSALQSGSQSGNADLQTSVKSAIDSVTSTASNSADVIADCK